MGFFDSKTLPDSKGKESFFGSYNIPVNIPTPEPQQSTSSKVGGVVKAVAKDLYGTAATIPVRAAQAEELLRTSFFGGTDSKKKAMEFASQPVDIGFGTQVKPLDTSSIGRAAQQTVGDIIKTASLTNIGGKLTLAKQAALQGGAYSLGNAMSEGKFVLNTPKDTAFGAAGGLLVGKGMSVAGKLLKGTPKDIPSAVTPELPTSTVIPENTKAPYVQPKQALKPATKITVPQELPPKVNPITGQAEQIVPPITPKVSPTSKSETITYPRPQVAPTVPKPVSYTKDPVQSLTKVMETELPPNTDPTFVSTTLANQTAKYDAVASVTPTDELIDMAMGLKPIPEGLNPVAIHSLTSIRNDLTVEQAMRLKNIYPLSQAGQDLSLARLKSGAVIDNPIDMMQSVEKELKEQVVKKGVSKIDIKNLFPDCGFN